MFTFWRRKSGQRMTINLYSKADCPLCDEAKVLLFKHLADKTVQFNEVNIDDDPELVARFGDHIPVVEIDGMERFRGRVNETLLVRILQRPGHAGKTP